jgi:CIC family chloride channel protein
MKGSIMTEKILRRGVKTPDTYEPDILSGVAVRQLVIPVKTDLASRYSIAASDDAGMAAELMGKHNVDSLLVKEDLAEEKIIGMITARSLLTYYSRHRQKEQHYQSPAATRRMMVQGRKFFRTSKIMGI